MQEPKSPPPAKRRRQRRKELRPSEIIDAAIGLWLEKGFAATKLDDVAKAAGVAKGTIYLYFESKEALFQSAMEERLVVTIKKVGEMGAAFEGSTEELLRRVFGVVLQQITEGGGIVFPKVLIAEGHRFPNLVDQYRNVVLERAMMVIRAVLARGVKRGELSPSAADIDPRLVMAPLIMSALWDNVFASDEGARSDELIEPLLALLLNGLRLRPEIPGTS